MGVVQNFSRARIIYWNPPFENLRSATGLPDVTSKPNDAEKENFIAQVECLPLTSGSRTDRLTDKSKISISLGTKVDRIIKQLKYELMFQASVIGMSVSKSSSCTSCIYTGDGTV